jgi:hypothetical protein
MGFSLPKISLPKINLNTLGSAVFKKGVEVLKSVAKDVFTPAKDGRHIFKDTLGFKVGPFDIRLKNPVEVLAEKLLGKGGDLLRKVGIDPSVVGKAIGGGNGALELPGLKERADAVAADRKGANGIGGVERQDEVEETDEVDAPEETDEVEETEEVEATDDVDEPADIEATDDVNSDSLEIGGGPSSSSPGSSDISLGGTDFGDRAINKFSGGLSSMDSQIDAMLSKGGELNATDQVKLQRLMQKRSELFQLLSQIMQMEHETKKNIIGNIR